ncbi:hypothetical protein BGZ73_003714 [Actinomortierella ambigua]|nr:hypothetical protein BGZ73_003714 [Actinomortierella ambigua]
MARNVFDTRELVVCIAAHLDKKALLSCVQVSKAWTNHFIPILWGSLKINGLECYMRGKHYRWMCFIDQNKRFTQLNESASESFAKYGHYIRELVVENPGAFASRICPAFDDSTCRWQTQIISNFANASRELSKPDSD